MGDFVQWLTGLPMSRAIRASAWVIPFLQTIHVLAIGMMLSAVVMIDLRVWGFARSQTLRETANCFLPWFWLATSVVVATGIALVVGEPRRSLLAGLFEIKMLLMLFALAATIIFHLLLRRYDTAWDADCSARRLAGILAAAVLALWFADTVAGRARWIAQLMPR